jgi:hypothetical protein
MRHAEFPIFESGGFEVALCTGPNDRERCPLVENGECRLAEQADVVLFGLGLGDEHQREVLQALRRRFPATPVVVKVRKHSEWEQKLPGGCHALAFPASLDGQIWAIRKALEPSPQRASAPHAHADATSRDG